MCGRYASFLPAEALARIFGTVNPLPNLEVTWNMAPTRDAPVVRLSREVERHFDVLKWGLIPYFTKDLKKARKPINARSETIAKAGMFKRTATSPAQQFRSQATRPPPRPRIRRDINRHSYSRARRAAGRGCDLDSAPS
jgi:putative SOS response-associated peptidase YedK